VYDNGGAAWGLVMQHCGIAAEVNTAGHTAFGFAHTKPSCAKLDIPLLTLPTPASEGVQRHVQVALGQAAVGDLCLARGHEALAVHLHLGRVAALVQRQLPYPNPPQFQPVVEVSAVASIAPLRGG
jgi:hypothetical protein